MQFYSRNLLVVFLLCFCFFASVAQNKQEERELPPVSSTYAITNAIIIQSPGKNIGRGNVVLKDGLIVAVGKNAVAPADAILINGDSLYVYAGFIDGLTRNGVSKPKEETSKERPKDPGNPLPEQAGITPQQDVRSTINPEEKSINEFRALGFTAAQVVPYGGFLPGTASIILFNDESATDMVLAEQSSFFSELVPAQRVYPNTVIAVIAKWRELYAQALQAKNYEKVYASNRSGLTRPADNQILEAFYPVIARSIPVLFEADKYLETQRVISLQNELGFSLVLGDIKEGWNAIPSIRSAGAKVFLSLDLPEDKKFEPKPEKEKEKKKTSDEDAKKDPEKEALEKRKEEAIQTYTAQAATFSKAGIPFGFSTLSVKATDVQKNLRRMIAAGLTEDQALAALTTMPAAILGLSDRLGTIETGKIANLVLSDKPYFSEKAKVKYVFVDGVMFKYEPKDDPKKETSTSVDISGTWTITTENPDGKFEDQVTFSKDGNSFSGSITGARFSEAVNLENIELIDKQLKFSYTTQAEGQSMKVDVDVTVEGDTLKGTASSAGKTFTITGKKNPKK
ncbi:MAG TPA: amidohydrolase family protein [Chryseosolibacter sp.]|nr:amidohydrolase family protein [Chryseosolibacter sp.]